MLKITKLGGGDPKEEKKGGEGGEGGLRPSFFFILFRDLHAVQKGICYETR